MAAGRNQPNKFESAAKFKGGVYVLSRRQAAQVHPYSEGRSYQLRVRRPRLEDAFHHRGREFVEYTCGHARLDTIYSPLAPAASRSRSCLVASRWHSRQSVRIFDRSHAPPPSATGRMWSASHRVRRLIVFNPHCSSIRIRPLRGCVSMPGMQQEYLRRTMRRRLDLAPASSRAEIQGLYGAATPAHRNPSRT